MEKVIHPEQFIERDEPKPRTYEIFDDAVNSLNLPERFKIMDEVIDQEGASQELAEELGEYGKSLKNKQIGEKNSVMDVVQNLQLSLNGFAERANKKGLSDIYKERISKNFGALKEYLNLLRNYKKFENAELSDEDGFLGRKLNERKETEELRTNKIKYVEESKKFLESEAAERKAA